MNNFDVLSWVSCLVAYTDGVGNAGLILEPGWELRPCSRWPPIAWHLPFRRCRLASTATGGIRFR